MASKGIFVVSYNMHVGIKRRVGMLFPSRIT